MQRGVLSFVNRVRTTRTCVMRSGAMSVMLLLAPWPRLRAQTAPPAVSVGVAAAVLRARALADAGNGMQARQLLDSLVEAVPRESTDAGEALYWRGLLSEEAPEAERDWKRLIVEVPLSPRVSDVLLRLADLDLLRNNATLARQHVQQLLTDFPDAPERPRALLVLARSYFSDRDAPRACGVLTVVRREAPLGAVETRLQADEMQQDCRNVREVAFGATGDSAASGAAMPPVPTPPVVMPPAAVHAPAPLPAPSGTKPAGAPAASPPASGRWTVQLAAYDTRAQADALIKRLAVRRIDAHTVGSSKPYRVQVGHYATRAEAVAALAALRKKGQSGFVAAVAVP